MQPQRQLNGGRGPSKVLCHAAPGPVLQTCESVSFGTGMFNRACANLCMCFLTAAASQSDMHLCGAAVFVKFTDCTSMHGGDLCY